jgi:tRNA-5-taurinomethyluridine 2-sulfurtransferase
VQGAIVFRFAISKKMTFSARSYCYYYSYYYYYILLLWHTSGPVLVDGFYFVSPSVALLSSPSQVHNTRTGASKERPFCPIFSNLVPSARPPPPHLPSGGLGNRLAASPFHSETKSTNAFVNHLQELGQQLFPSTLTVSDIQQKLVRQGLESLTVSSSLSTKTERLKELYDYYASPSTKVPGCAATVHVQTILEVAKSEGTTTTTSGSDSTSTRRVHVKGTSDAHLSRGLLGILCSAINEKSFQVADILNVDPSQVSQYLQLQSALSVGRNDGLSNILRTIQQQLAAQQELFLQYQQPCVEKDLKHDAFREDQSFESKNDIHRQPTAALLLSGGVDSSVALHLLLQQGYNVTAFYLKIWLEDELAHLGTCPWEDDVDMCQQVCQQAGVPLEIVSLQSQYHRRVMKHTLEEAAHGRTPNPDILCNSRIKFGTFLELLEKDYTFFDVIASGHYAQVKYNDQTQRYQLFRAPDPVKDQSYFLCALTQRQLSKLTFPIGHLEKSKVRELAQDVFQLPNRHRADSQGLCFLGKLKFNDFLHANLGSRPGDIVNALTGESLGRHAGVWYHTVGQRKGLGPYLHPLATSQGPWYVVAKDPARDIVYASNQYDQDVFEQARSEFHVEEIHWMEGEPPPCFTVKTNDSMSQYYEPVRLQMKIRHGPRLVGGTLELSGIGPLDNDNGSKIQSQVSSEGRIRLDAKDGGLAPGQYVVFYSDDAECLGGGIISERHWAQFLLDHQIKESRASYKSFVSTELVDSTNSKQRQVIAQELNDSFIFSDSFLDGRNPMNATLKVGA